MKSGYYRWLLTALVSIFIFSACTKSKTQLILQTVPSPSYAMIKLEPDNYPTFDLSEPDTLIEAVNRDLKYLNQLKEDHTFNYGKDTYIVKNVKESLVEFLVLIEQFSNDNDGFNNEIKKKFNVYQSLGSDGEGKTLFTGYYVPTINGSFKKSAVYRYPIYTVPSDIIPINLGEFSDKYKGETIWGRYKEGKIVPYYTHKEIFEGALDNRGLELIWVDDRIKLFFMQVQGSGVINLPDGKCLYVGYAGSNGHVYKSIGRYFVSKGFMKLGDISMQSITAYLNSHPQEIDNALFFNPSYVFFKKMKESAIGDIGIPLVPMRAIATDLKVFPKAALAYIETSKPECNEQGEIIGWNKLSRFVLNQDTGGALKGPGHVDFFWGSGSYAEIAAGNLKNIGRIYFLIKK